MPPINRDASELSRVRRAKALYSFKSQLNTNFTASGGNLVTKEQAEFATLDVVTQRQLGACSCGTQGVYPFVGPGGGGGGGN